MKITIEDKEFEIDKVFSYGYLPLLKMETGEEFYVAESSETAGEAASEACRDMAEEDNPDEFIASVGEKTLVSWAMGKWAAGARSLDDWFENLKGSPEEEFANYDGSEIDLDEDAADPELVEELGFTPTVAYRHN